MRMDTLSTTTRCCFSRCRRQGGHSLPFEQNVFCKRLDSRELIMLLCEATSKGHQDWTAVKCSRPIGIHVLISVALVTFRIPLIILTVIPSFKYFLVAPSVQTLSNRAFLIFPAPRPCSGKQTDISSTSFSHPPRFARQ
jgi:hypothetical protein